MGTWLDQVLVMSQEHKRVLVRSHVPEEVIGQDEDLSCRAVCDVTGRSLAVRAEARMCAVQVFVRSHVHE